MSWKKQLLEGDLLTVRKNTGADVGTRKRLNFIEGSDISLTIADDAAGDEIDITTAVDNLPTSKITSGTFDVARIPDGVVGINYVIDGGGAAIGTGIKGDLEVPLACHVDRWTLLADQHGSIVVDVWRDSYANFPPTDADSMPGTTNMPAISGTIAAHSSNLSGWGTQGVASGDILRYNVNSCTSIELCTLALKVTKK